METRRRIGPRAPSDMKVRYLPIAALLMISETGCSEPFAVDTITTPGDYERILEVDGLQRSYELHVPPGADLTSRLPLVVVMHGVPVGEGMRVYSGMDAVSDELGFVVAYPKASAEWAVGCDLCTSAVRRGVNDIRFFNRMLDKIAAELPIDDSRVYAAGFSQGALMAHHLACAAPERFAAFASVAATMLVSEASDCRPSRLRPIAFVHGTADAEFPVEGRARSDELVQSLSLDVTLKFWADRLGCAETPETTLLPDVADDETRVRRHLYRSCSADLRLYEVEGGGHTWPGGRKNAPEYISGKSTKEIDANQIIWDFFKKFRV